MATDRLAELQATLDTYREGADEVPFLMGLILELDAKLQIAETRNADLADQLEERTRQLNGLLDSLSFDERAVPR
ncbi:hypothetical protein ACFXD5_19490 [Streptomyces sp. NPDC059385]|uniref:hypothetical protein n=1 Tax=Streptomyces sp. NPDC059385 TaxID=3346817 RepID=UPI0036980768